MEGVRVMTKCEIDLAQAQSIAKRAMYILDEHDFWQTSADGEFWEASLHRDLTRLAEGKEFKTFRKERKMILDVIKELENGTKKK